MKQYGTSIPNHFGGVSKKALARAEFIFTYARTGSCSAPLGMAQPRRRVPRPCALV